MPTAIKAWPPWPDFSISDSNDTKDPDFLAIKKTVIAEYGGDALRQTWIQVCQDLQVVTDEIVEKGNTIIPVLDTAQILSKGFSDAEKAEVKRIGSFICRATLLENETNVLYKNMSTYVAYNKSSIQAWPKESPSMLILYNSPTQNAIRSHPNHLNLQRKLDELWHGYDISGSTSPEPLVYLDGLRDRAPGQPFLGLGPHIDAGSLCRWADPSYRKVYDKIFRGFPEDHDAFDIVNATMLIRRCSKGLHTRLSFGPSRDGPH
jgi:hypothetical protein